MELLSPRLFKALGDPSRLQLVLRLAEVGGTPCTVGHVAAGTDLDVSVVSRHLAILRDAGVIECVKRGKEVWCAVRTEALARTLRELADALEVCCPPAATCAVPPRPARGATPKRAPRGREEKKDE
ncbi:MAG TPA: metalloregulator ArsR/SmtB family transcription factor [Polyangia bacterium]|jgi:ArsR family transcriptional regulator